jgi:hypothetical protein
MAALHDHRTAAVPGPGRPGIWPLCYSGIGWVPLHLALLFLTLILTEGRPNEPMFNMKNKYVSMTQIILTLFRVAGGMLAQPFF